MKWTNKQPCIQPERSGQEPILQFSDVSVNIGQQPILHHVSFAVRRGEFVRISGHNGSGKSTILRTVEGLERPEEGSVTVFGQDVHALSRNRRERLFAGRVGMGFQVPLLTKNASPIDNMRDFAEATGNRNADTSRRIARLAGRLGLGNKLHESTVAHLSGGEQQRLALGALLVTAPELVLLDEPTSMLDDDAKQDVFRMLRQTVDEEGTTIVMVSHDEPAAGIIDRQIDIQHGHVVFDTATTSRPMSTYPNYRF